MEKWPRLLKAGGLYTLTKSVYYFSSPLLRIKTYLKTFQFFYRTKVLQYDLVHFRVNILLYKLYLQVAFRFVACSLIGDVQVCCLCGSTPALLDIEQAAAQCFKNSTDILKSASQCTPRNFPSNVTVDGGILG